MPRQQATNSVGGQFQKNDAHYIELFAALASLDFASTGGSSNHESDFRIAAVSGVNLVWDDFPIDDPSLRRLMGGVVALHTFLSVFRPDGGAAPGLAADLKGATWLSLMQADSNWANANARVLDLLGDFFSETWKWLRELRISTPSLEIKNADVSSPPEMSIHEVLVHRGKNHGGTARRNADPYTIFRHWNAAAYRERGTGLSHFLEVMRLGSEAFAESAFGAPRLTVERN
jgi:hypothetical protein